MEKQSDGYRDYMHSQLKSGAITKRQYDRVESSPIDDGSYLHFLVNGGNELYRMIEDVSEKPKLIRIVDEVLELWNHRGVGDPLSKPDAEYLQISNDILDRLDLILKRSSFGQRWTANIEILKEFVTTTQERKGFRYPKEVYIADPDEETGPPLRSETPTERWNHG